MLKWDLRPCFAVLVSQVNSNNNNSNNRNDSDKNTSIHCVLNTSHKLTSSRSRYYFMSIPRTRWHGPGRSRLPPRITRYVARQEAPRPDVGASAPDTALPIQWRLPLEAPRGFLQHVRRQLLLSCNPLLEHKPGVWPSAREAVLRPLLLLLSMSESPSSGHYRCSVHPMWALGSLLPSVSRVPPEQNEPHGGRCLFSRAWKDENPTFLSRLPPFQDIESGMFNAELGSERRSPNLNGPFWGPFLPRHGPKEHFHSGCWNTAQIDRPENWTCAAVRVWPQA